MLATDSKIVMISRVLVGLVFTIFSLNFFFPFMPQPPPPPAGGAFLGALAATGYMFPMIKLTELAAGLLLLSGRWVPFALVLVAPVTVNIVAYHLFLDPAGAVIGLVLASLSLVVAWAHRSAFLPLFTSAGGQRSVSAPATEKAAYTS